MAVRQFDHHDNLTTLLQTMGLELQPFEHSLASGVAEAASYSAGAPSSAPEFGRWARMTESLHDGVIGLQRGWERHDPLNQPTWLNPGRKIAVVISSGDENTGQRTFREPTNRNPKGSSFGVLVEENVLFSDVTASGEMASIHETWVFLYDAREGFVYSELSLPIIMPGRFIGGWRERILFPRFDGRSGLFEPEADDSGPDQNFDFTIARR